MVDIPAASELSVLGAQRRADPAAAFETAMVSVLGLSLATFATVLAIPVWRDALATVFFVVAAFAIVLGLLLQVWIPAVQLRRFSRIFAGRPEAVEAFNRVVQVYGWRARLACKLFSIPIPPGVGAQGIDKPVV